MSYFKQTGDWEMGDGRWEIGRWEIGGIGIYQLKGYYFREMFGGLI